MLIMAAPAVCGKDMLEIWQVVGWILFVFKIVIPIIIIVFGMIDLGKAVVASKDDEIKKALKSLMMRAIAGIVVFFVPTLVGLIFSMVGGFQEDDQIQKAYESCKTCITNPGDCKTESASKDSDEE